LYFHSVNYSPLLDMSDQKAPWKSDFQTEFQKKKGISTEESMKIIDDAATKGIQVVVKPGSSTETVEEHVTHTGGSNLAGKLNGNSKSAGGSDWWKQRQEAEKQKYKPGGNKFD